MEGDGRRHAGATDDTATYPALPRPRGPESDEQASPPFIARRYPEQPPAPRQYPEQPSAPRRYPEQPSAPRRYLEQPPAPRRTTTLRAALFGVLAFLLFAPAAAVAYTTVREEGGVTVAAQELPAGRDRDVGPGAPAGRSPAPGGTHRPAPTTVDGRIRQALADQAAALLADDQDGFLAAVDPSAPALRDDLARRFGSLRQLQVKVWQPTVKGKVRTEAGGTASAIVAVQYCFVVQACEPMGLEADTRWNVSGKAVTMLAFGTAKALGPRPWEASELHTAVGSRVVMSTTAKYASRLSSMLATAEKAAVLTDKFARWGSPPSRYVVYLAGPDEWASWYGINQAAWVAGFAMPLNASATEIVVNAARIDTRQALDVLRHEFTHVVTLDGVEKAYPHTWWLVEGVAEYVRMKGAGNKPFDGMADVRSYARSGRWDGTIALDDPPDGATTTDVSGRYGVAYLSLQHLAERYGEDRLLDFFGYAVRQGVALGDAAPKAFGVSWDDIQAECAKAVRAHV
ncbi:basic secretory protein-like protein [Dactylosporangium sp. NPDC051485]|uniref:basic secretory protein-like protein n=1 Tax=Dactylosporangium sp. NPDC051485 TaxID=3154846 RepID=UPI0034498963